MELIIIMESKSKRQWTMAVKKMPSKSLRVKHLTQNTSIYVHIRYSVLVDVSESKDRKTRTDRKCHGLRCHCQGGGCVGHVPLPVPSVRHYAPMGAEMRPIWREIDRELWPDTEKKNPRLLSSGLRHISYFFFILMRIKKILNYFLFLLMSGRKEEVFVKPGKKF